MVTDATQGYKAIHTIVPLLKGGRIKFARQKLHA